MSSGRSFDKLGIFPIFCLQLTSQRKEEKQQKQKKQSMVPPSLKGIFQKSILTSRSWMLTWAEPWVRPKGVAGGLFMNPNSAPFTPCNSTDLSTLFLNSYSRRELDESCDFMLRLVADAFLSHFWKQRLFHWHGFCSLHRAPSTYTTKFSASVSGHNP